MDRFTKFLLAGLTFGVLALALRQSPVAAAHANPPTIPTAQQLQLPSNGVSMTESGPAVYDPTGKAFILFPAHHMPFVIIHDNKIQLWTQVQGENGPTLEKVDQKTL